MNTQHIVELGALASNSSVDLSKRVSSVHELGSTRDGSTIAFLKALLGRKIDSAQVTKNWDPAAAERVVELHAIATLHQLGDDSELPRIPGLVEAAGRVLQGPYDERRNAATIITAIGSARVIGDLIGMLPNRTSAARDNVIEVLDTLALPEAPVRQNLGTFASAAVEVSGVGGSLRNVFNLMLSASKGSVRLSPGVERMIASGASPDGGAELHGAEMSWLLQRFLPSIGLDYYLENGNAVICTFTESALRWGDWWSHNATRLAYSPESRIFILSVP